MCLFGRCYSSRPYRRINKLIRIGLQHITPCISVDTPGAREWSRLSMPKFAQIR